MTEYELQDLLISSRWEFDIPSIVFLLASLTIIVFAPGVKTDRFNIRLLQRSYFVASLFLMIRTYAAIIRAQKLGALVAGSEPLFEFWNPAVQTPTLYIRIALFLVLIAATLIVLERTIQATEKP